MVRNPPRLLYSARVDNDALMRMVTTVARASVQMVGRAPRGMDVPRVAWEAVRRRTRYIAERGDQYVRTPRAFMLQGVGDCKSQAVFVAAMCKAAGYDVIIRYIIKPGERHYSHVYAVVNGTPVDPMLPYGVQCRYLWASDDRL